MQIKPAAEMYEDLHAYLIKSLQEGVDTHMVKVSYMMDRMTIKLDVQPAKQILAQASPAQLNVARQPQVWSGGSINSSPSHLTSEWLNDAIDVLKNSMYEEYLPVKNEPAWWNANVPPKTIERTGRRPQIGEGNFTKDDEEPKGYTSGLASMG